MNDRAKTLFDKNAETILRIASERYALDSGGLKRLGSFESVVYEYRDRHRNFILKITDSIHRSPAQVRAELHWVDYLANNGVPVCRALPSTRSNFVEVITPADFDGTENISFSLIAIEMAAGRLSIFADRDNHLIEQWGQITGRMHALTKTYRPPDDSERRLSWFDDGFIAWETCPPHSHGRPVVIEKCQDIIRQLRALPKDNDAYGLIHTDLHHGNFFVTDGAITIFDTDDCRYDWFAHDLAIPLLYSLFDFKQSDHRQTFAGGFLRCFMNGYRRENTIDDFWLKQIPLFMKLRELDLYLLLLQEDASGYSDWCRRFMDHRRESIENDSPLVTSLMEEL